MSISPDDIKFFGSEYPVDVAYGGGKMSSYIVQDDLDNNVFPNVSDADRAAGRVQLRKIFAAVVAENADPLLGVQMCIAIGPTDVGTDLILFGDAPTRAQAAAGIAKFPYQAGPGLAGSVTPHTATKLYFSGVSAPDIGAQVLLYANPISPGAPHYTPDLLRFSPIVIGVEETGVPATPYDVEFDRPINGVAIDTLRSIGPSSLATRCYGATTLAFAASPGDVTLSVGKVEAQLVPALGTYPTSVNLLDPTDLRMVNGKVPIFRAGESAIIREGATDELVTVASVQYPSGLTLSAPLANAFSSGATISSLLSLGDMAPSVGGNWSQQTWTRVFSDTIIGNPISSNYSRAAGAITIDNLGGATERWAVVFTSTTAFKLVGESIGEIAVGNIADDFLPTNPITGAPYFTITAAGWGTGWANGNVLRFNTIGSRAGFWMGRTVSPSAPGGDDSGVIELRGSL